MFDDCQLAARALEVLATKIRDIIENDRCIYHDGVDNLPRENTVRP